MNNYAKLFKNKFALTSILFVVYILFLDDIDIFTIINQKQKLYRLEANRDDLNRKLDSTKILFEELRNTSALESFAREKKFFKRKNEDIFVITKY